MYRIFVVLAACCAAWAMAAGGGHEASSRSGLHAHTSFGHFEVATAIFNVSTTGGPQGELTFAADGHHHGMYPDLVVMSSRLISAQIRAKTMSVVAEGTLNNDPVTIYAVAIDGGPNGKGDSFKVSCLGIGGATVFSATGEVISGDISIR